MSILEVRNISKIYTTRFGSAKVQALSDMNFSVEEGEYAAIMGESGSGKTTLLNILASLDKPTGGEVLLDNFSLKDNILLPLVLQKKTVSEMEERLEPIAERLGITKLLSKYPYEVSGGQKQRAAVARAIITKPQLILADEPTGAIDSKAAAGLLKVFREINGDGQTILMVTHSINAASHANRILFIKDGEVFHQLYRGNLTNEQLYVKISDTLTVLSQKTKG